MITYRVGSACTGYGGLDMAIEKALAAVGIVTDTAWFVEYDAGASATLAHHWPDVPNHHDATTIDWAHAEVIDLFCAGYPCQPFSAAGRRKGADDERHIWPYLAIGNPDENGVIERPGAIAALRPRLVVFENVAGHLTLGFDTVLADLHQLGYDVYWTLWNASDEGAPHRRRRLFILGIRRDQPAARPGSSRVVARHDEHDGWVDPDGGLFGSVPFTGRIPATGAQIGGDMLDLAPPVKSMHAAQLIELLGTPRCADGIHHPLRDPAVIVNPRGRLEDQVALLPTPRVAADRTSRGAAFETSSSPSRGQAVELAAGDVPREFARADEMPMSWQRLLPTPTARDHRGAGYGDAPGRPLSEAVHALLPTPAAGNFNDGESVESWKARRDRELAKGRNGNGIGTPLAMAVKLMGEDQPATEWGAYGPAIRRWEQVIGRGAPAPTMTGARGGQQLAPSFVEWMMGLPEGHVCDVPGQSRAEKLKRLGNGVVPRQATAAVGWLATLAGLGAGQVAA